MSQSASRPTGLSAAAEGSPAIRTVERVLPTHYADQEQIIATLRKLWAGEHYNVDRLEDLHRAVRVKGRYLALPVDAYEGLKTFRQKNDAWIEAAVAIGERAIRGALDRAGLEARDIDHIFFVTVTGVATPSIDARLVNRLGFRTDVKRTPIFGLGCVAGAAGIARVHDYLRAFPGHRTLLLSIELCSLTLQREDVSVTNVIASGLFGDGAAAVVLQGGDHEASGEGHPLPRILGTRSVFYPESERVMGWDVVEGGFKVVLSPKVPTLVRQVIARDVDGFLEGHGLTRGDIKHWVAHTGGPKVLEAFESGLSLPSGALRRSWASLEANGNLSSASVLFVLGELLDSHEAASGDYGLLLAMGPGFCSELVLLRW